MMTKEGGKANKILSRYWKPGDGNESIFSADVTSLGITLPLKPDAAMAVNSAEINIKDQEMD